MTRNVLCNVVTSKKFHKFYHVLYEKMNQEGCRGLWSWSILSITIQEWVTNPPCLQASSLNTIQGWQLQPVQSFTSIISNTAMHGPIPQFILKD